MISGLGCLSWKEPRPQSLGTNKCAFWLKTFWFPSKPKQSAEATPCFHALLWYPLLPNPRTQGLGKIKPCNIFPASPPPAVVKYHTVIRRCGWWPRCHLDYCARVATAALSTANILSTRKMKHETTEPAVDLRQRWFALAMYQDWNFATVLHTTSIHWQICCSKNSWQCQQTMDNCSDKSHSTKHCHFGCLSVQTEDIYCRLPLSSAPCSIFLRHLVFSYFSPERRNSGVAFLR